MCLTLYYPFFGAWPQYLSIIRCSPKEALGRRVNFARLNARGLAAVSFLDLGKVGVKIGAGKGSLER